MDPVLVLGAGNRLPGDDAAGPLVIDGLARADETPTQWLGADETPTQWLEGVTLMDGGTIGLALLPITEAAGSLISAAAARLGVPPGAVSVLQGEAMDHTLAGRKRTAQEVALADLLDPWITCAVHVIDPHGGARARVDVR